MTTFGQRDRHPLVDVGVLTVIRPELAAARGVLGELRREKDSSDGTVYWHGVSPSALRKRAYSLVLAGIGAAGDSSSAAATRMIVRFRPAVMLLVGIAAGVRGKVRIGDVVLSERVVAYESAALVASKDGTRGVQRRPEIPRIPRAIVQDVLNYEFDAARLALSFKRIKGRFPKAPRGRSKEWEHVARAVMCHPNVTIASGEALLQDPTVLIDIRRDIHGKTEAGEMEAAGFADACEAEKVEWLVVRGISDFGDDLKDDRFHEFASKTAAVVMADFLTYGLDLGDEAVSSVPSPLGVPSDLISTEGTRGVVGVTRSGVAPVSPNTLPSLVEVCFVGRAEDLAALDAWRRRGPRVMVLHGEPGVGKTRLAVEWAHSQHGVFPDGRFHLSFRHDPYAELLELARLFDLTQQPGERLAEWAMRTLRHVGARDALLILDDLQAPEQLAVWLLRVSTARVLVVTGSSYWPMGYSQREVRRLADADARGLVLQVISDPRVAAMHVDQVIAHADGNLVQLVVDASVIDRDARSGRRLHQRLELARETAASFEWAWSVTTREAQALLCALACFRAQRTPRERVCALLAIDGWADERFDEACAAAVESRLVTSHEDGGLDVHPLLRTFARLKAGEVLPAEVAREHARAFAAKARAFARSPGDRTKYAELAHDEFDAGLWDQRRAVFSWEDRIGIGDALREAGQFSAALPWYQMSLEQAIQGDRDGHGDHAKLGMSLHLIGYCLSMLGRFEEAAAMCLRAVEEKRLGDALARVDHTSLGRSLHQVGFCLSSQGKSAEALSWYVGAAEETERGDANSRIDHSLLSANLHEVGSCLSLQGRFAEATSWYQLAAEHARRGDVQGRVDHASLGMSLNEVGRCLSEQGMFADALPWYWRAIEAHQRGDVHGRVDRMALGVSLYLAGLCLTNQRLYSQALPLAREAVTEQRHGDIFGRVDREALVVCLEFLADLCDELGHVDEAISCRDEARRLHLPG